MASRLPALRDLYGRLVRRPQLLRERAAPSLASVRQPYMLDAVAESLTPGRVASAIRAADAGETRQMYTLAQELEERYPRYGAVMGVRRRAVMGVEPSVESASDGQDDIDLADEIRALARGPGFRRLLSECLWGLGSGVAAIEILWDRSGPLWAPRRYAWRDPRWFRWDREDPERLRVLADEDQAEGVPLEPFHWIVHCPRLRPGIPARGGLARPVAALFCLAAWSLSDWAGWLENYGRPIQPRQVRQGRQRRGPRHAAPGRDWDRLRLRGDDPRVDAGRAGRGLPLQLGRRLRALRALARRAGHDHRAGPGGHHPGHARPAGLGRSPGRRARRHPGGRLRGAGRDAQPRPGAALCRFSTTARKRPTRASSCSPKTPRTSRP